MVNISQRPAEVADRAVAGHWEGDLLLGAYCRSAVATLVERQTRYVLLARLGNDRRTQTVERALIEPDRTPPGAPGAIADLGSRHASWPRTQRFTSHTGVQVYFCDPHSPWQRGSNENTNGLLRQYLPEGTDLAVHDQPTLDSDLRSAPPPSPPDVGMDDPRREASRLLTPTR